LSLRKQVQKLIGGKVEIIKYWIKNKEVRKVLKSHYIDKEFFLKNYAFGIIDYYFEVILHKKQIGDCPVMGKLLRYLKGKDIKCDELFIICNGFRNAIIEYAFDLDIVSREIEIELNYIFERNFTGVLQRYATNVQEVENKLGKSLDIVDKYIIRSRTDPNGIITYVSDAFCKISGYTKEELIGHSHNIIRHPDMPSSVFENMWKTIQSGKVWHGEVQNLKKDGGFYWVDATIEPILDKGKIIAYDAIRQDITDKKAVQRQQSVIVEQSKSAAMGEMISMIAHQWRQPLQAVSILIQKLPLTKMIDGEISDEVLDQVVDDIGMQLEYMSKTIDDFRDFFKPERNKEFIMVSKLIDRAKDFLSYMLKIDSINLKINEIEDANISIHINEVVQVLINIIKNARDAMIDNNIENREIEIRYSKTSEYVVIEIEDNAGGIPKDIMGKIFEPYFSTKTNKNGTGLGLYMGKTIIEQHSNGIISVRNSDKGAVFKIELPLKNTSNNKGL